MDRDQHTHHSNLLPYWGGLVAELGHPSCLCSPSSKNGSSPLKSCEVTAGLAESNGTYFFIFFNGLFSRTTWVSRYQKGKTNLDVTEARDSEWQWHQLGHMQVCTSLQTDNHASTPPLCFLQAGCPSCRPTNSVKALKATDLIYH